MLAAVVGDTMFRIYVKKGHKFFEVCSCSLQIRDKWVLSGQEPIKFADCRIRWNAYYDQSSANYKYGIS